MARFYSNENFPQPTVEKLRELGHDVLTTLDAGNANQAIPDDKVVQFATNNNRAVLTLNRKDFIQLHRLSDQHKGIIICKFDPLFEELANRIHHKVEKEKLLDGKLIRVNKAVE